ncbi:MAG: hypothetical protein JMN25_15190 [gamma proteobacterium endosymbiont of Lamellibrachia anaximandri]|nr:hypothetical protein [gamma proteobacterium endosymbiont of Lamellibrachia anaximandri]
METPQTSELDDGPYISYYRTYYGPDAVGEALTETDQTYKETTEVDLSSMDDPTNYYNW